MNRFAIRGVMLDPARLMESRATYRRLIPMLADWGYNALFWHFTDDQGCALRFPSHPEVASRHAYTPREMETFIRLADRHGMQVIPEIEALGHAGCLIGRPTFAHLRDGLPGKMFGAIAPLHPETQDLLRDLLRDAARLFPSPYLHAGLDEVGFGAHPHTRRLMRKQTKPEIFAAHVRWVHSVITGLGKTMLMWGDHLLPPNKEHTFLDHEAISAKIADLVPKDIVICDWHYEPDPDPGTVAFFLKKGFRVVACPAAICWGSLMHPRDWNLHSLRDFARVAARTKHPGVIGMMNTVWCPFRNFPGTLLFGMALGAHYQRTGGVELKGTRSQLVKEMFGLAQPRSVVQAIETLHATAAHVAAASRMLPYGAWEVADTKPLEVIACRGAARGGARAAALLARARRGVTRNRDFFDDVLRAANVYAAAGERPDRFAQMAALRAQGIQANAAGQRVKALAIYARLSRAVDREARLASEMYREAARRWAACRFTDDPKRDGRRKALRYYDALVPRLLACANWMERLHKQARRLAKSGTGSFDLPDVREAVDKAVAPR